MSIERILEPEVMDSPEEARDYNAMDHSSVNVVFVDDFLLSATPDVPETDILDLGTGTALIPIELCERDDECRVMAVDASIEMLELARFNIDKAGMLQRIQLQKVDAKTLGFSDEMFHAVISNSIIHHIPDPIVCLAEAVRVTKKGGRLFFRDLLRPESEEQLQQLVETYTGQESEHAQQLFGESLHAALTVDEVRDMVESLGFDRQSVNQTTDRHWTWAAIRPTAETE